MWESRGVPDSKTENKFRDSRSFPAPSPYPDEPEPTADFMMNLGNYEAGIPSDLFWIKHCSFRIKTFTLLNC